MEWNKSAKSRCCALLLVNPHPPTVVKGIAGEITEHKQGFVIVVQFLCGFLIHRLHIFLWLKFHYCLKTSIWLYYEQKTYILYCYKKHLMTSNQNVRIVRILQSSPYRPGEPDQSSVHCVQQISQYIHLCCPLTWWHIIYIRWNENKCTSCHKRRKQQLVSRYLALLFCNVIWLYVLTS